MSLNQFKKLDPETRKAIINRVIFRKHRFLRWTRKGLVPEAKILLVGDCPANDAPNDPEFHFTPFGALWNSSLFINLALHNAGIAEQDLAWCNAADYKKVPTSYELLVPEWPLIVALGGAAEKWIKKAGKNCVRFDHPAYHKRWKSKEEYPLIPFLKEALG